MNLGWKLGEYEAHKQLLRELYTLHTTKPVDVEAWLAKNKEIQEHLEKVPLV